MSRKRNRHPSGGKPHSQESTGAAAPRAAGSMAAGRPATLASPGGFPIGEDVEPGAGAAPTPAWMFALLALLIYLGEIYLVSNGGDLMGKTGRFPAALYDPYMTFADLAKANPVVEGDIRDKGRLVFERNCQQCHQATGQGMPGQFPPLVGSEWVLAAGPNRIIRNVLNGFTGPVMVKGVQFNNNMFAFRDLLSDQDIAAVLTFIRSEWGNGASPVKPEQVKKVREATADRSTPWTEAELLKLPESD